MSRQLNIHRNTQKVDVEWNRENRPLRRPDLEAIFRQTGVDPGELTDDEVSIFQLAFTHSSMCVPANTSLAEANRTCPEGVVGFQPGDYEALEFFGDAVIHSELTQFIARRFRPYALGGVPATPWARNPGNLTRLRVAVECNTGLATLAQSLGLGKWVLLSSSAEAKGMRSKKSVLEDVMEAFVGAADFIESARGRGGDLSRRLVRALLEERIEWDRLVQDVVTNKGINNKEALANYARANGDDLTYRCDVSYTSVFSKRVAGEEVVLGVGTADTEEQAKEIAAKRARGVV